MHDRHPTGSYPHSGLKWRMPDASMVKGGLQFFAGGGGGVCAVGCGATHGCAAVAVGCGWTAGSAAAVAESVAVGVAAACVVAGGSALRAGGGFVSCTASDAG